GYVFAGWYKDTECKVEYDFASDVSAELTLYAKWTKVAETPDSPINWTLIGILIGVVVIGIAVSVVLIIKNKKKK
ncbi:MAG: InlB B-repeat-containing protein, partial [Clostridia bacterium]